MRPLSALPREPEPRAVLTVEDRRAIRAEISARLMAALDDSDRRLGLHFTAFHLLPGPRCDFCGVSVAPGEVTCADCACLAEDYCAGDACDCREE